MAARALSNQMSRTVRVNRSKLIQTLIANKHKHVAEFAEAMAGYKGMALQKVDEAFDGLATRLAARKAEMVAHIGSFSQETAEKFADHMTVLQGVTVELTVPRSYADAYDAAIDMATFDTREELDLSGAEFQCFCRDVWDWTYEFSALKMAYSSPK